MKLKNKLKEKLLNKKKEKIMNSKKFPGMMPYGNYDWKDIFSQGFI